MNEQNTNETCKFIYEKSYEAGYWKGRCLAVQLSFYGSVIALLYIRARYKRKIRKLEKSKSKKKSKEES